MFTMGPDRGQHLELRDEGDRRSAAFRGARSRGAVGSEDRYVGSPETGAIHPVKGRGHFPGKKQHHSPTAEQGGQRGVGQKRKRWLV